MLNGKTRVMSFFLDSDSEELAERLGTEEEIEC